MARIAGINIPQNKLVHVGLTYIYGIGEKFSGEICKSLAIPRDKRVNQLTDDETNTILKRFDTYMNTTEPVLNYYSENPKFKEIDGSLEIDEITRKIDTFINV